MRFRALKSFKANGQVLNRDDEIELEPSRRTQDLVSSRYLLPLDPKVEAVTKTPSNQAADDLVVRQAKRKGT